MSAVITQIKKATEIRNCAFDMTPLLDAGELLASITSITESTGDLTITNESVSTAQKVINGKTVDIGEAAQCRVSGGTAPTDYVIRVVALTDANPAQTVKENFTLSVVSDDS